MNWSGSDWQELYRTTAYECQDTVGNVHWTDGLWVCWSDEGEPASRRLPGSPQLLKQGAAPGG